MAEVRARYYTDPACPWSWSIEPAVRTMQARLGDRLSITYVMTGLYREVADGVKTAREWLEAGAASGMPVDARLWLESPPRSSYPACMAVVAAAEQGDPGAYLRRLREGFACGRRKLDIADALVEEAVAVPDLDTARFRIDLESNAIVERLGADLDRAAAVDPAHHGRGGRVRTPSIEFEGPDGEVHGVYGPSPYAAYREAVGAAGAGDDDEPPPGVLDALHRFGTLSTAEVAAVCDLAGPRAPAELWRLAGEWQVRPEHRLSGELWTAA